MSVLTRISPSCDVMYAFHATARGLSKSLSLVSIETSDDCVSTRAKASK